MSAPITAPTYPTDSQPQIPCDPDRELGSVTLKALPSWLAGSSKSAGFQRSLIARVFRSLQAGSETLRDRIIGFRETDPKLWAGLASEAPFWVVQSDRNVPFGDPTVFAQWQAQAAGNTPFIADPSLKLSQPGILTCLPDNIGFFTTLPARIPNSDEFWQGGSGPAIYQDPSGKLYLRDLDRVTLAPNAALSAPSGFAYLPYTGDSTAVNFPFTTLNSYSNFDSPLFSGQEGYRPPFLKRIHDVMVYDYDGVFDRLRSWDVVSGGAFQGILLPQMRVGEEGQVSYVSAGKHRILEQNPIVLFQGDERLPSYSGIVSGPWYPADSQYSTTELWGVPSHAFISLFPPVLRRRRSNETHSDRINRLLLTLKVQGNINSNRGARWSLLGAMGYINPISVSGAAVISGEVFIPSLEEYNSDFVTFTREDINLEPVRETLVNGIWDCLISATPLLARHSGSNFGGGGDLPQVRTRFSPFSRSTIMPKSLRVVPQGVTPNLSNDPVYGEYSYAVGIDPSSANNLDIQINHPKYISDPGTSRIYPGSLGSQEIRDAYQPAADLQVKTIEDAYIRGDQELRGPDRPTNIWSALTQLKRSRSSWADTPSQYLPVANSAPLDLNLNIIPPTVPKPTYGTGSDRPVVSLTHPIARDYA